MSLQRDPEHKNLVDDDSVQEPGRGFSITLQINYEDTDAGGVVYYGNYLGYMERARNAFLRSLGWPLARVRDDFNLLFVVTEASINYHAPAVLDDEIQVTLEIAKLGAASVVFGHNVLRDSDRLVSASIKVATVHGETFRPLRIPAQVRNLLLR